MHNELIETINAINPSEVNSILTRKQITSFGLTTLTNDPSSSEHEYLNLCTETTPTPSEHNSLASSPNSIQLSTNTSCSSSRSQHLTPELHQTTKEHTRFLNYLNADFIDNSNVKQFTRQKNSRTKLTKIVDNFNYLNCAENLGCNKQQQPINFVNSPNHSPVNKKSTKKSTIRQLKKSSNEEKIGSSLLMKAENSQRQNNKCVNNENLEKCVKKSTKSLSSLTQINSASILASANQSPTEIQSIRRQSSSNIKNHVGQLSEKKVQRSGCPNFYENTKYIINGEQETLV